MTGPAILLVTILTAHGALPSQPYLVERRECPALAAAVHVNTAVAYRGWSVWATCRDVVVLPAAAEGLLPGADRGQDKSGIDGGPFRGPPIWQRFFECVALGGLGLGGAVWCIEHLDDKWRRLSTALIGGCCLLVIGAFGLLWSALLPATWGWWL